MEARRILKVTRSRGRVRCSVEGKDVPAPEKMLERVGLVLATYAHLQGDEVDPPILDFRAKRVMQELRHAEVWRLPDEGYNRAARAVRKLLCDLRVASAPERIRRGQCAPFQLEPDVELSIEAVDLLVDEVEPHGDVRGSEQPDSAEPSERQHGDPAVLGGDAPRESSSVPVGVAPTVPHVAAVPSGSGASPQRPDVLAPVLRKDQLRRLLGQLESVEAGSLGVIAEAGLGKSVLLGQLHDALSDANQFAPVLVRCDATWRGGPQVALQLALGLTDLTGIHATDNQKPVLLFDTVDLALDARTSGAFSDLFRLLVERGATVVFACRDWEYSAYGGHRLIQPRMKASRELRLPRFTDEEARSAMLPYLEHGLEMPEDRACRFAERVLELAIDRRRMDIVVHSPLHLAMLCRVYGPDGDLPGDLTVRGLYDELWRRRVAVGREDAVANSPRSRERTRIAYRMAQRCYEGSSTGLRLTVSEHKLVDSDAGAKALDDLMSEGIVRDEGIGARAFFHQTFLEYLIARWLVDVGGRELDSFLSRFGDHGDAPSFLVPILRSALVLLGRERLVSLGQRLALDQIPICRAYSYAVASLAPDLLAELWKETHERGPAFQNALLDGLEALPAGTPADLLLNLLTVVAQEGTTSSVIQVGSTLVDDHSVDGTLLALALETIRTSRRSQRDVEEISGQLVRQAATAASDTCLLDLVSHRDALGHTATARVIEAVSRAGTEHARGSLLWEYLADDPPPKLRDALRTLAVATLNDVVRADDKLVAAAKLGRVLELRGHRTWTAILANASGRVMGQRGLRAMVCQLVEQAAKEPAPTNLSNLLVAIRESAHNGLDEAVLEGLCGVDWDEHRSIACRFTELVDEGTSRNATWCERLPKALTDGASAAEAESHVSIDPAAAVRRARSPRRRDALAGAKEVGRLLAEGTLQPGDVREIALSSPRGGILQHVLRGLAARAEDDAVGTEELTSILGLAIAIAGSPASSSATFTVAATVVERVMGHERGGPTSGTYGGLALLVERVAHTADAGMSRSILKIFRALSTRSANEALRDAAASVLRQADFGPVSDGRRQLANLLRSLARDDEGRRWLAATASEDIIGELPTENAIALGVAIGNVLGWRSQELTSFRAAVQDRPDIIRQLERAQESGR